MIEINLLPEELKLRNKAGLTPQDYAVYIAAGLVAALLVLHLTLGFIFIIRQLHLGVQTATWKSQEPLLKKVENFKQEYAYLFQDGHLPGQENLSWSQKLNSLSNDLPAGIWLNELASNGRNFQLKGSIFSLQKNEVGLMNEFLDALKKDRSFFGNFVSLEPGPLKRRVIVSYEVVDFSLQGIIKAR